MGEGGNLTKGGLSSQRPKAKARVGYASKSFKARGRHPSKSVLKMPGAGDAGHWEALCLHVLHV